MTIRGVLFDFSSTLFRLEPDVSWLDGTGLDGHEQTEIMVQLTLGPSRHLPDDLRADWDRRDLDPETHRRVYLAAYRAAGMDVVPGLVEQVYAKMIDPASWKPYPDTAAAVRAVRDAGLPVGVLSNIAWDIRPTLELHGIEVDAYVLSYVEGVVKPDPKIFAIACERIGVAPAETLMIGDSAEADGGATALGCRFGRVAPVPTQDRPDSLVSMLNAYDIAV
ncbi:MULTISPECIES: HAD family hydrolase [Actinokineospora]|uniref:HAD family hydrolase n=1 Tax=Actinokineospora TaxID=39845 RepID=UPI001670D478|nr:MULTISPECIES: HAD-IA family hydrolase [Actinokineospora]